MSQFSSRDDNMSLLIGDSLLSMPAELIRMIANYIASPTTLLSFALMSRRFHINVLEGLRDAHHYHYQLLNNHVKYSLGIDAPRLQVSFFNALPNGTPHGKIMTWRLLPPEAFEEVLKELPSGHNNFIQQEDVIKRVKEIVEQHGVLYSDRDYCFGFPHGKSQYFYGAGADGRVAKEEYYKKGELDGVQTCWYGPSSIQSISSFRAGKLHGTKYEFHPHGLPQSRSRYEDGMLNGEKELFEWVEGGFALISRKEYKDDQCHGKSEVWNPSGVRTSVEYFKQNKLCGEAIYWSYSGSCRKKAHHDDDGRLHGVEELYLQDGTLTERKRFHHGLLHGCTEHYDDYGRIRKKILYNHNKKEKVEKYDKTGRVIKG